MSNKRFGTIETLQTIFAYPDTFFDLVQLMDERQELSVPEHDLLYRIERAIRQAESQDKKRLHVAFRTENLVGSGLLSIDKKAGVPHLYFDDSLIQLLRICDRSLRQDLTNAKLKNRLSALRSSRDQVLASSFSDLDYDFTEASQAMSGELNSVIRLVHGNVRDLELDVDKRMEEISAEISVATSRLSASRHYELLGEITTIHQRHILPTLEFLNPSTRLKDGDNLHETLESLGQAYRTNGHYELADQVDRSLISLNETYKPIQSIAKRVQEFVAKNQRSLRQHNAMEAAFDDLRDLLNETQTGRLNRIQMQGSGFVRKTGFVEGLVNRNYPTALGLHTDASSLRLMNSDLAARMEDAARVDAYADLPTAQAQRVDHSISRDRARKLFEWVKEMSIPETSDLVAHIHERLQAFVGGYESLVDLMDAVGFVMEDGDRPITIHVTNRFRVLEDHERSFIYRLRRVQTLRENIDE